jgi:drug/metabolite transporter (DMT)-like permease
MILQVTSLIIGFKILALVLGGLITYLAFKAYRKTGARSLGALSLGFGIITAGTFLAGVVNQVFGASFQTSQLIESALIAVGFLVIVYSLYMTQP